MATATGWGRYLLAWLLVVAAVILSALWARFLGPRNLALPFIAAVMIAGSWLGTRPALTAAVLGFLAYNFFLVKPHFVFTVAPADLLALATFLSTAMFVGGMAGRLSDRARAANQRSAHLTALLAASHDFSAASSSAQAAQILVEALRAEAGVESAVWTVAEPAELLAASEGARITALAMPAPAEASRQSEIGRQWRTLETVRGPVGAVSVWFGARHASPAEQQWIDAVLQLGAIALDRVSLASEMTEAKLVAEKEGLRTALLSSLSHDLRTPIATILASASSLSANEARFGPAARLELASAIETEAERLNLYVSNLLDMTRLESGALDLKRTPVDPCEAMASALERMRRRLAGLRITRRFGDKLGVVSIDPILLEQVLVNLLENAASFSPAGSEIVATVEACGEEAILSVIDHGPGVPGAELPRVFEKFFRGRTDRARRPGVGLGLAVARGLVEAFDGRIAVESPVRAGRGTRVVIHLPMSESVELTE